MSIALNKENKIIILKILFNEIMNKNEDMKYGYDIWIKEHMDHEHILWQCAAQILNPEKPSQPPSIYNVYMGPPIRSTQEYKIAEMLFPLVLDILWHLALKGVLRPGVNNLNGQVNPDGTGYSLTLWGRSWITSLGQSELEELASCL